MATDNKGKKEIQGETIALPKGGVPEPKESGETRSLLIIERGPRQGTKFQLASGDNTIGRGTEAAIKLDDSSVSRQHSVISPCHGGWTIEDQGSRNGTIVNGCKIGQKVAITPKDTMQIGIYTLKLIVQKTTDAKPVGDWEGKTMVKPRR